MNYKTKPCERCGKEIKVKGQIKYCIECRKLKDDEIYKARYEKEKLEKFKKRVA